MKLLPLAYNKDLQEYKEGAVDAAHTLRDAIICIEGIIEQKPPHCKIAFTKRISRLGA